MSAIETAIAVLGGTTGIAGVVGGAVKAYTSKKDIEKAHAEKEKAEADAEAKTAAAELVRAEMMQAAQNMIAAELGTARGELARAKELHEDCTQARAADAGRLADCEVKHAETAEELSAAKGTIKSLGTSVLAMGSRVRALQLASGISDETLKRFTPRDFPAVKPPPEDG